MAVAAEQQPRRRRSARAQRCGEAGRGDSIFRQNEAHVAGGQVVGEAQVVEGVAGEIETGVHRSCRRRQRHLPLAQQRDANQLGPAGVLEREHVTESLALQTSEVKVEEELPARRTRPVGVADASRAASASNAACASHTARAFSAAHTSKVSHACKPAYDRRRQRDDAPGISRHWSEEGAGEEAQHLGAGRQLIDLPPQAYRRRVAPGRQLPEKPQRLPRLSPFPAGEHGKVTVGIGDLRAACE